MIKKICFLFTILPALLFTACQTKPSSPGADIKAITIKNTELGRQTMFKITCESFDKYFPKPNSMNIISKPAIDTMMRVIGDMKVIDQDNEPDVRAKIYITHNNNKVDTLCLGVEVVKYNQLTYKTPDKLLLLIQQ